MEISPVGLDLFQGGRNVFIWSNVVTVLMTLNGHSVKLGPEGALEGKFHLLNASQQNSSLCGPI